MTERCFLKCRLCDEDTLSKYDLIQHIYQHLSYRKYQCASCTERFYSEEERDLHCIETEHFHTHEINLTPYCELYVNQLLKDAEYAVRHGIEAVVEHRTKASLACDVVMNKLSSCAGDTESPIKSSSPKQETKSSSSEKMARKKKSKAADDAERNRDATCEHDQPPARVESSKQTASSVNETKTPKTDDSKSKTEKSKADLSGAADELRNVSFCRHRQAKPFPWHQLPQKLKVRILQNLRRRDLDECVLVDREMFKLIRHRIRRRSIEHLNINMVEGAFQLDALYTEEGIAQKLVKELRTLNMVSSCLSTLLKNADIHRLEFAAVPLSDDTLSAILACLLHTGCRVYKLWMIETSMATVSSSILLRFLREAACTGIWLSCIRDCTPHSFSPEVLQFIVTRQLLVVNRFHDSFIPIYDDMLAKLTATHFLIGAPNMITMNGLKSFVERLVSGKQRIIRGKIFTNFLLKGVSFPKVSNSNLEVMVEENYIEFLNKEEAPDRPFQLSPLDLSKRNPLVAEHLLFFVNDPMFPCGFR